MEAWVNGKKEERLPLDQTTYLAVPFNFTPVHAFNLAIVDPKSRPFSGGFEPLAMPYQSLHLLKTQWLLPTCRRSQLELTASLSRGVGGWCEDPAFGVYVLG